MFADFKQLFRFILKMLLIYEMVGNQNSVKSSSENQLFYKVVIIYFTHILLNYFQVVSNNFLKFEVSDSM